MCVSPESFANGPVSSFIDCLRNRRKSGSLCQRTWALDRSHFGVAGVERNAANLDARSKVGRVSIKGDLRRFATE